MNSWTKSDGNSKSSLHNSRQEASKLQRLLGQHPEVLQQLQVVLDLLQSGHDALLRAVEPEDLKRIQGGVQALAALRVLIDAPLPDEGAKEAPVTADEWAEHYGFGA